MTPRPKREIADSTQTNMTRKLEEAFGDPIPCLQDFDATEAMRLAIEIEAIVSTSGRVTRSSVSARGLSLTAVRCLERKASALVLPDVRLSEPTAVSATVEVDYKPATIAPQGDDTEPT